MTPGHAARKWTSIRKAGGGSPLYLLDWIDPRGQSHREILPFLQAVERRKQIAELLARAWNKLGLNRRGRQAITHTERNKQRYDEAKANKICPRCQKNPATSGTQCDSCLEYLRQYQRRLYYARKAEKAKAKAAAAQTAAPGNRAVGSAGTAPDALPRRKPGRPPKQKAADASAAPGKTGLLTQEPPRRPGRPRKHPLPEAPRRRPGRPPKEKTPPLEAGRKPGRPPKSTAPATARTSGEPPKDTVPRTPRHPGRPPREAATAANRALGRPSKPVPGELRRKPGRPPKAVLTGSRPQPEKPVSARATAGRRGPGRPRKER